MGRNLAKRRKRVRSASNHGPISMSARYRVLHCEPLEDRWLLSSSVTGLSFRNGDQLDSPVLDSVNAGDAVYLHADATEMEGQLICVELREDDGIGIGDDKIGDVAITIGPQGFGTCAWAASWQADGADDPQNRYYLFYDASFPMSDVYSGAANTGHFEVQVGSSFSAPITHDWNAFPDSDGAITATLERVGDTTTIDSALPTWIVIHGKASSASTDYIHDLAQTLTSLRPADGEQAEQVLTLDWHQGAAGPDSDLSGEAWIKPVAKWASTLLVANGFSGSQFNLIGHSWGAVLASEFSASITNGVKRLVALDPAEDAPYPIGAWGCDMNDANFGAHSSSVRGTGSWRAGRY